MLIGILGGIAAVVIVFLVVVALRPADFRITRRATVGAPPSVVFAHVNDFHRWEAWSPWEKLDPAMRRTFSGAASGVDAGYAWVGNKKVGEGRMTITECRPDEVVRIKLEFLKPFPATNTAEFSFQSSGDQTTVTWSMFGKNNFMAKAFGLFVNMDRLIGRDFEKGLAQLKSAAEAGNK